MIGFDDMDMIVEILENRPLMIAEVSLPLVSARGPLIDVDKLGKALKEPPDRYSATIGGHGALGTFDHISHSLFPTNLFTFSGTGASLSHTDPNKRIEEPPRHNVEQPLFSGPTVS
jgi:hypothetical protein